MAFYLVVVDYREDSPTYLQWDSFTLDDKNYKSVLVPISFKWTFMFIRRVCISLYSIISKRICDWQDQITAKWNDPMLKINWPIDNPILSERDK